MGRGFVGGFWVGSWDVGPGLGPERRGWELLWCHAYFSLLYLVKVSVATLFWISCSFFFFLSSFSWRERVGVGGVVWESVGLQ